MPNPDALESDLDFFSGIPVGDEITTTIERVQNILVEDADEEGSKSGLKYPK
jgi:hypothetical protein